MNHKKCEVQNKKQKENIRQVSTFRIRSNQNKNQHQTVQDKNQTDNIEKSLKDPQTINNRQYKTHKVYSQKLQSNHQQSTKEKQIPINKQSINSLNHIEQCETPRTQFPSQSTSSYGTFSHASKHCILNASNINSNSQKGKLNTHYYQTATQFNIVEEEQNLLLPALENCQQKRNSQNSSLTGFSSTRNIRNSLLSLDNFPHIQTLPTMEDIKAMDEEDQEIIHQLVIESEEDDDGDGEEEIFQKQYMNKFNKQSKQPDLLRHYKYHQKIEDLNKFRNTLYSPFSNAIEEIEKQNILPKKLGIFSNPNQVQKISAQNQGIGGKYSKVFAEGINTFSKEIKCLDISSNNLKDEQVAEMIQNLSSQTEEINISYNQINFLTCKRLNNLTEQNNSNLKFLNLEGNQIGNKCIETLIQSLTTSSSSLKSLNLSKTSLTSEICIPLYDYLLENQYLEELYLHWNNLHQKGFRIIGEVILINSTLKVLDLSYNGIEKCSEEAKIWAKVFERDSNSSLQHLDLSFNNFNVEETQIMVEGLQKNHTIYGFHYDGNPGYVDCLGFLNCSNEEKLRSQNEEGDHQGKKHWQLMHRINSVKVTKQNHPLINCWICEGWVEVEFQWVPKIDGNVNHNPIYIHFEFDGYIPHQMEESKLYGKDAIFTFKKMCPPNYKIYYCFTAGGHQLYALGQDQEEHDSNKQIILPFGDKDIECYLSKLNFKKTGKNFTLIDEDLYIVNTELKPRKYEKIYLTPPEEEVEIPWSFENSIFRYYKRDIDALINQCFEFDWSCCKTYKVIKEDEINNIKEFFRPNYRQIKNLYKHYSSFFPCGEIWSLSNNVYSELLSLSNIIDGLYGYKDADFNFIATNSSVQKQWKTKYNPQRSLVRYQLMEILIRNVNDKYFKTLMNESLFEGLQQAFENGFSQLLNSVPNEHQWKQEHYWTEFSDKCITYYKFVIEYVFMKNMGHHSKIIKKMKLQEFRDFVISVGISEGDKITERDINLAYNLSLQTQVDELTNNRHMEMNQLEFYEALARLADILSLHPHGYEDELFWSKEQREQLPIHIKLESLLIVLYNFYAPDDKYFREDFQPPESSIFEEHLKDIRYGINIFPQYNRKKQSFLNSEIDKTRRRNNSTRESLVGQAIVAGFKKKSEKQRTDSIQFRRDSNQSGKKSNEYNENISQNQVKSPSQDNNNSKNKNNNTDSNSDISEFPLFAQKQQVKSDEKAYKNSYQQLQKQLSNRQRGSLQVKNQNNNNNSLIQRQNTKYRSMLLPIQNSQNDLQDQSLDFEE